MSLLNNLLQTRIKIGIAKLLYRGAVLFFRDPQRRITRSGIHFEVDLTEGIDLSLFLFGNFQKHVVCNQFVRLAEDAVVFDVGANAGIMTLQFAQAVPRGRVYAFEPTHYAFAKLQTNLSLNPALAARVTASQVFVSSRSESVPALQAFASWKVDGSGGERHPVHLGTALSTENVSSITIDDFVEARNLHRLDFVKIDTDGHELEVLKGAVETLKRLRPAVIFEIGLYIMLERGIGFEDYEEYFGAFGYRIVDGRTGKPITSRNHRRLIPAKGTLDALALPSPRAESPDGR